MKKIFFTMLIFFVSGCGYSSIYKNQSQDFQIKVETMDGDNEFNNFIKNELKLYSNINSQTIYLVSINSTFKKIDIAKDSSGVASDYELSILTNINVLLKQIKYSIIMNDNVN